MEMKCHLCDSDRIIRRHRSAVAWRVKNDFGHWVSTTDKALADTWANIEKLEVEDLYNE